LTAFERWSVWSTSAATLVTGTIYLWMKYFVVSQDPLAVVNHPWQPYVLKLHILVAPLLIFSLGLIALRHVWWHWKENTRAGRRSALITLGVWGPMVMTGYLIQVITHQGLLQAMALSHIATGLVFGIGLLAHQFAAGGKKARSARAERRRLRRRQSRGRGTSAQPTADRDLGGT
jgi:hypothetical protein